MNKPTTRGTCPECEYRVVLRWSDRHGWLCASHRLFHGGNESEQCKGTGLPPKEPELRNLKREPI